MMGEKPSTKRKIPTFKTEESNQNRPQPTILRTRHRVLMNTMNTFLFILVGLFSLSSNVDVVALGTISIRSSSPLLKQTAAIDAIHHGTFLLMSPSSSSNNEDKGENGKSKPNAKKKMKKKPAVDTTLLLKELEGKIDS